MTDRQIWVFEIQPSCFNLFDTAQVNKNMPRTFGDALVHQSHFDYAVQHDMDLPQHGGGPPSENESKIGEIIAGELIEDGCTLQMGTIFLFRLIRCQ